jgi:hypothetical protein
MAEKPAKLETYSSAVGSSTPDGRMAAQLNDHLLVNGKLITVKLSNATTVQYVSHPLDRAYRGAYVVGQSDTGAALTVLRGPDFPSTYDPKRMMGLKWITAPASSSVTVDLWVF